MSGAGAVHAQVRRQTQFSGDRPLKLTTYRDSEIDEKTIQLLKVKKSYFKLIKKSRAHIGHHCIKTTKYIKTSFLVLIKFITED